MVLLTIGSVQDAFESRKTRVPVHRQTGHSFCHVKFPFWPNNGGSFAALLTSNW
jgi:hypothetical protein